MLRIMHIDFMACHRQQINAEGIDISRYLYNRLSSIGVKKDSSFCFFYDQP